MMENITLEIKNHIGIVTFDHPPVNCLNYQIYKKLVAMFDQINKMDEVRVVVFRAAGKRFCVGNDVNDIGNFTDKEKADDYLKTVSAGVRSIYKCRVPVVMAIQGACVGGGLAMAACSDIIIASEDAYFGIPEIKIGAIGCAGFLALLVPDKVVRYMAYTGNSLTAQQLQHYGAVHKVVAVDKLFDTAMEVANELLQQGPIALRYFKEAININSKAQLEEEYAVEAGFTIKYVDTEDFSEAVKAFLEKRKPEYKCK